MNIDILEEDVQHEAEARDGKVHPLDGVQARRVLALEEILARDERSSDGRYSLEALTKV
jgi:hypothetical protein